MTDREKLILGLSRCLDIEGDCAGCPYEGKDKLCGNALLRDALAVIRGDMKARVLTLTELNNLDEGTALWEEYRQDDGACGHLAPAVVSARGFLSSYYEQLMPIDERLLAHAPEGFQFRFWSAKPTEEEREAVPWTIS